VQHSRAESEAVFENIFLVVTPELAYSVDIERASGRLAGRDDVVLMVLRSTTIYRLENGTWRMTQRHADALIDVQSVGGEEFFQHRVALIVRGLARCGSLVCEILT
jgi:hypothetical protein